MDFFANAGSDIQIEGTVNQYVTKVPHDCDRKEMMVEVFFSCSHQDEGLRNELEKHLSLLRRQGVIDIWSDHRIGPGEELGGEIDQHLELDPTDWTVNGQLPSPRWLWKYSFPNVRTYCVNAEV